MTRHDLHLQRLERIAQLEADLAAADADADSLAEVLRTFIEDPLDARDYVDTILAAHDVRVAKRA